MRILWFNWRDIKNPDAGGAEIFTHEIMVRLAKKGYDLTLFAAKIPNYIDHEVIDGVKIIRGGGKYSVYTRAKQHYDKYKNNYDLVIDENNTRPFLSPKFVKDKPILVVIHSLAREGWFYETPFPLNYIGYHYLEKRWLSNYKDVPCITVSNSTKRDLELLGFKRLFLVTEGLSISPLTSPARKESFPTLVFISRLKRHKLPHHAMQAFSIIKKRIPDARMWVIGDGYMRSQLEALNIQDVTFYGYVKDQLKCELLSRAHLALVTGVREGWGLVVIEANAMGTPAVAYNIPGLRDSVRNGETGILVQENTPECLAESAISLLRNNDMLAQLSYSALDYSKKFKWENTADAFDEIIKHLS